MGMAWWVGAQAAGLAAGRLCGALQMHWAGFLPALCKDLCNPHPGAAQVCGEHHGLWPPAEQPRVHLYCARRHAVVRAASAAGMAAAAWGDSVCTYLPAPRHGVPCLLVWSATCLPTCTHRYPMCVQPGAQPDPRRPAAAAGGQPLHPGPGPGRAKRAVPAGTGRAAARPGPPSHLCPGLQQQRQQRRRAGRQPGQQQRCHRQCR